MEFGLPRRPTDVPTERANYVAHLSALLIRGVSPSMYVVPQVSAFVKRVLRRPCAKCMARPNRYLTSA